MLFDDDLVARTDSSVTGENHPPAVIVSSVQQDVEQTGPVMYSDAANVEDHASASAAVAAAAAASPSALTSVSASASAPATLDVDCCKVLKNPFKSYSSIKKKVSFAHCVILNLL